MTFQFLCPQGHLLEGEEAHMGMQCQCPQCGTTFLIPFLDQPASETDSDELGLAPELDVTPPKYSGKSAPPAAHTPRPVETAAAPASQQPAAPAAGMNVDLGELGLGDLSQAAEADLMLHIPCPNGHELETPPDMIGQRAKCPHCGAEFRLKRESSVEYQRELDLLYRRRGKFWFQVSVVVASFVFVVLLVMIGLILFT